MASWLDIFTTRLVSNDGCVVFIGQQKFVFGAAANPPYKFSHYFTFRSFYSNEYDNQFAQKVASFLKEFQMQELNVH